MFVIEIEQGRGLVMGDTSMKFPSLLSVAVSSDLNHVQICIGSFDSSGDYRLVNYDTLLGYTLASHF